MRTYYTGIIIILLVVCGMLLYPSLNLMTSRVDTTGFLPLTKAAGVTFVPYFFLFMIGYAIFKFMRR